MTLARLLDTTPSSASDSSESCRGTPMATPSGGKFGRQSVPSEAKIGKTLAPCHVVADVRPFFGVRRRARQYADGFDRRSKCLLLEREHPEDLVASCSARDQIFHFRRH